MRLIGKHGRNSVFAAFVCSTTELFESKPSRAQYARVISLMNVQMVSRLVCQWT